MNTIIRTLATALPLKFNLGKSILLLGPRQVGKSTLIKGLKPALEINLAKQAEYFGHLKDPSLIEKMVATLPAGSLVFVDEIQRIPEMINTIQALIDEKRGTIFCITGSSARKLKRKEVNLLPGRIYSYHMFPLTFWEMKGQFDLLKCLRIGGLPEVYLNSYGPELLKEYINLYLREEIQSEALVRNLSTFSNFLDIAATISGQEINYSSVATDSEIPKESLRRYFDLLYETLIVFKLPGYTKVKSTRKAIQKEKIYFFDLGVRNGILKIAEDNMLPEQLGHLFEQWVIQQIHSYNSYHKKEWEMFYYRDNHKTEVDLIIKIKKRLFAIEIKWSEKSRNDWCFPLETFEAIDTLPITSYIIYRGKHLLKINQIHIIPFEMFFNEIEKWLK